MKGGRELDAKVTAPLFPRLHVNDAANNKVGPRAPPRNKMALYEQLSIPSSGHRFREHAAAAASAALAVPVASPHPQHGSSAAAASGGGGGGTLSFGSQGMGCTRERNLFPPYYLQQATAPPNDDKQSRSSTAINASTLRTSFTSPSPKSATQACAGVSQSADGDDLSAEKEICKRNLGNEDDFMVPTFFHSVTAQAPVKGPSFIGRCRSAAESEMENAIPTCNESNQNQKSMGLPQEQLPGGISTSKKCEKFHTLQNAKATEAVEPPIAKNVIPGPVAEGNTGEPSMIFKSFSSLNDCSALAGSEKSVKGRVVMHLQGKGTCDADATTVRNVIDTTMEAGTIWPNGGKLPSLTDNDTLCTAMDQDDSARATHSGSPSLEELEKNEDDSETSELDSEPSFDISPDDVVGVIGPKHFWKARRAIANQQRVFAVQVFELHRLIKVQKLIAASPQLLLEGGPCLTRSQTVPSKKQRSVRNSEQAARKDDLPNENHNGRKTDTMRVPQHPPEISHKRQFGEILQNGSHSGGTSSLFHMGSEGRPPGPWCFPPSGSQWLVPVMSPSEGLVYKPYVGPCPPTGAFMAPFVGGCGPFVAAPAMGGCVRPAYGFPSPIPQPNTGFISSPTVTPGYFPDSYGFPVANRPGSPPATEQLMLARGSDEDSQSLSSDSMSNHQSEAASGHGAPGGQDDLYTGTSSSPNASTQEGAGLSSFVMSHPSSEGYGATMQVHESDAVPRVIRVVPHNRRTATESAARIFQFIQEERQHHEPV